MDRKFINVIMLGLGFMFLFTAFQTMGNIEKTVLDSITADNPNFHGDGYTSLAIIYAVLAVCNWLAPSALSLCGPRGAMIIGSLTYCFFMISFLWPQTWLLYVASGVLGAGAALIWTGQGTYLSRCSDTNNISRNSGVFWALLQASMLFGNLFVYFQFQGKTHIDQSTLRIVFFGLISVAILGVIFFITLRRVSEQLILTPVDDNHKQSINTNGNNNHFDFDNDNHEQITAKNEDEGVLDAFKNAVRLFLTKDMLLLSVTFLYTGFELSFYSGVYSNSIGFTLAIGSSSKQYVGLSGICIGIGEIFGGVLFGLLGSKTIKYGRDPIVIIGFFVHVLSFILIFLNLPNVAAFGDTESTGYYNPPVVWIALSCSLLLGFGDACFNTQIYSMLGGVFAKQSTAAFAVFKFTQSVAAAASFVYSSHLGLHEQMIILIVFGILGTTCFCVVEWAYKRKVKEMIDYAANK